MKQKLFIWNECTLSGLNTGLQFVFHVQLVKSWISLYLAPPDAVAVNGNTTHYVNQFKRIDDRCKNPPHTLTPCNVTQRHDYKNEEHKPNPTPPSRPRSLSPCFPSEEFAQGFREWEDGCWLITYCKYLTALYLSFINTHTLLLLPAIWTIFRFFMPENLWLMLQRS